MSLNYLLDCCWRCYIQIIRVFYIKNPGEFNIKNNSESPENCCFLLSDRTLQIMGFHFLSWLSISTNIELVLNYSNNLISGPITILFSYTWFLIFIFILTNYLYGYTVLIMSCSKSFLEIAVMENVENKQ